MFASHRARQRSPIRSRLARRRYLRRRILVGCILLICLTGLSYGAMRWLNTRRAHVALQASLPFQPERLLPAGGAAGNQVAIGPAQNAMRQIALLQGSPKAQRVVGEVILVPDFPLQITDLPRASGLLVQSGRLPSNGEPLSVRVAGEAAVEVRGGEPDFRAWRLDDAQGLVSVDYYALAAPLQGPAPTAILVDKGLNVLWHYVDGQLMGTYRVATGRHRKGPRPSAANHNENYLTPTGRFSIDNKFPGLPYYKLGIPAGHPNNPLGTRWLGFSIYAGDQGLVWGIHGTNDSESIGQWISDGCIRMLNQDVEHLYEQVSIGTVLEVVDSQE